MIGKQTNLFLKLLLIVFALHGLTACADMQHASALAREGQHEAAVAEWQKLSAFGIPEAKIQLARAYLRGNGVEKNPQIAANLLMEAVDAGNRAAMLDLGQLYETGNGVPQDLQKAEELYMRSADLGNARAFNSLGRLYEKQGRMDEAHDYYKRAAGYTDLVKKLRTLQ